MSLVRPGSFTVTEIPAFSSEALRDSTPAPISDQILGVQSTADFFIVEARPHAIGNPLFRRLLDGATPGTRCDQLEFGYRRVFDLGIRSGEIDNDLQSLAQRIPEFLWRQGAQTLSRFVRGTIIRTERVEIFITRICQIQMHEVQRIRVQEHYLPTIFFIHDRLRFSPSSNG